MTRLGGRMTGRFARVVLLTAGLVSACSPVLPLSPRTGYRVMVPPLTAAPVARECFLGEKWEPCVLLTRTDYETLIRQLKGACLALGGTDAECQTGE